MFSNKNESAEWKIESKVTKQTYVNTIFLLEYSSM